MTNAEKFGNIFGLYATELWSMPEQDFLKWLNTDVPDTNIGDIISRQDAIEALHDEIVRRRINEDSNDDGALDEFDTEAILRRLPPAQPEPSIPISWIDEQIEWLKGLDNGFSTITAMQISTMVNKWNREGGQNE